MALLPEDLPHVLEIAKRALPAMIARAGVGESNINVAANALDIGECVMSLYRKVQSDIAQAAHPPIPPTTLDG